MFHGFDYTRFFSDSPSERLTVIKEAMEHILSQEEGKNRFMQAVTELSKAFALSVPHEKALKIRDAVGFFQTVRASLAKNTTGEGRARIFWIQPSSRLYQKLLLQKGLLISLHQPD